MIDMGLIETTLERLNAFEPQEGYYGAFSGGKDSQVLYEVVKMSGVKCEWHFQRTSVDPPQLMTFIRENYPEVQWHSPEMTMFQLILTKKMLPTRLIRFCCKYLKTHGGAGRRVIVGVRAEESVKRSGYKIVGQDTQKEIVRPLLDWKWNDVWNFLNDRGLPHCELYDPPYKFKRIGCVGCPLQGKKMWRDFRFFPNVKNAYLHTIAMLMEEGKFSDFNDPEAVLRWWIRGVNKQKFMAAERQMTFCFDN